MGVRPCSDSNASRTSFKHTDVLVVNGVRGSTMSRWSSSSDADPWRSRFADSRSPTVASRAFSTLRRAVAGLGDEAMAVDSVTEALRKLRARPLGHDTLTTTEIYLFGRSGDADAFDL